MGQAIVEKGADVNEPDRLQKNFSPLACALTSKNVNEKIVKLLTEKGAMDNRENKM